MPATQTSVPGQSESKTHSTSDGVGAGAIVELETGDVVGVWSYFDLEDDDDDDDFGPFFDDLGLFLDDDLGDFLLEDDKGGVGTDVALDKGGVGTYVALENGVGGFVSSTFDDLGDFFFDEDLGDL